ncbi:potassium-transporting ATPase subunit KdpB [Raineyella sp. W15-4]|nr:potassium-transporting ATPase subunit KdpB [Raineyella sp. W15-4]WOQ18720.1 potassium-transporting ATPase subunit KdpB [Raineyella sp. W15-4]
MRDAAHGRVADGRARFRLALPEAFAKLAPRRQWHNPVIFLVWVGAVLLTALAVAQSFSPVGSAASVPAMSPLLTWSIAVWLWLTVLFADIAEAVAESGGRARTEALWDSRTGTRAHLLDAYRPSEDPGAFHTFNAPVPSSELREGDVVVVSAGQPVPADGDVVWGVATVDESVITGESAPVVREAGSGRSSVIGGTRVLTDRIVVRITSQPGETFLDRMITLVEGTNRRKTPDEIALGILLAALSVVFVLVVLTLEPLVSFGGGGAVSIPVLVALLVCLAPTTIGALLSAIGIAGMDRLLSCNVVATSGRAVAAAGDVSTLLLDKTGTITEGNRRAVAFLPLPGVREERLVRAAALSSLADPTPEGRSIVALAARQGIDVGSDAPGEIVPFTARTRMSGLDLPDGTRIRKGAGSAVTAWLGRNLVARPGDLLAELDRHIEAIARTGGTPLVVASTSPAGEGHLLGVVHLKDIVKEGLTERFAELRAMGIRTVMITGDNPLTAAAIAAEAGVDDVLAEATPEDKLALIRREQQAGRLVAMTGDGINDAPALAQADVGVAMNSGTSAAKEAGNMVDLDSDPTKLIDIVRIARQLLITRGALTTFSIANDIAKYFAIIPAIVIGRYPGLAVLNVMGLHSPASAVLSAVIFNATVIVALIPLALRGVRYRATSAARILSRNLLVYGAGGIVAPFVGIWLIDQVVRLIPGF